MTELRPSSAYDFPIFISSTDYNLKDLRAELAKFLSDLGCRPILSSGEGFPDKSPTLTPWECCLEVLSTCYINILVIDAVYGKPLPWPHFPELVAGRHVAPTHGEFLYAQYHKLRTLVFVRQDILVDYERYRTALKEAGGNPELTRERLHLPKRIEFEVFPFLHEVKTTDPIPWIRPFHDVTDIKREIQLKLINELAEVFRFKQRHLETVTSMFAQVLQNLPAEQQTIMLAKVGAGRDLIEKLSTVKHKVDSLQERLKEALHEIDERKKEQKAARTNQDDIARLTQNKAALLSKMQELQSSTIASVYSSTSGLGVSISPYNYMNVSESVMASGFLNPFSCAECGKAVPLTLGGYKLGDPRTCSKCNRVYCAMCWPPDYYTSSKACKKCVVEG